MHEILQFDLPPGDGGRLANLCGVMDRNLAHIGRAFEVRIKRRGARFRLAGDGDKARGAQRALARLYARAHHHLSPEEVQMCVSAQLLNGDEENGNASALARQLESRAAGAAVAPRTARQRAYLDLMRRLPLTLCCGPAGTGKTFLAAAAAVEALQSGGARRIFLTRPAVEAGERLGFLPGDLEQKINPYMRPLWDALEKLLGRRAAAARADGGDIEIAPLAFMRGRTLERCFVVVDEAQNATPPQMKMLLTRLGAGAKMAVCGDLTQVDLPPGTLSGLADAIARLQNVEGVGVARFTEEDVARHPLVARVIAAYDSGAKDSKDSKNANGGVINNGGEK